MKVLPIAALVGATVMSSIALSDAIWVGNLPETPSPWTAGPEFLLRLVDFGHAVPYLLLAAVLIRLGARIDAGRKFVCIVRWALVVGFGIFGLTFGWGAIADPGGKPSGVAEILLSVAFVATFLVPIVLGFSLIRRKELRLPVILLISPVVLLPLIIAVGSFSTWAHPAYLETAINFGVALLALAVAWPAESRGRVPAGTPEMQTA
jgi:hypothetical protein